MKARTEERKDPSSPLRLQRIFRGDIQSRVEKAEKDPYVQNRVEDLRRRSPRLLEKVPAISFSGREKNPLYHNRGDGTFAEIGSAIGLGRAEDGRGLVIADFDGDGDGDVFLHNYYRNPLLALRNDTLVNPPMIVVRLRGTSSNRFGIGARVEVEEAGRTQVQELSAGSGFLSGNPPELYFAVQESATVFVRWPLGKEQKIQNVSSRCRIVVTEGEDGVKREELAPSQKRGKAVVPKPPLRRGDAWPFSEGKGTKIVVFYRLQCHACREELGQWKEITARVKELPDTRLLWKSAGGDPEDLFLQLRREGVRIGVDVFTPEQIGKVCSEGAPVVPMVFVLDSNDRIRGRFVGPGSVDGAIRFLSKE